MSCLKIYQDSCADVTIVSNRFIDEFMPQANDAQLKIYLYLLRSLSAGRSLDISEIADVFNHTEKDVMRALKYWEKCGVLLLEFDAAKNLTGIRLLDLSGSRPLREGAPEKVSSRKAAANVSEDSTVNKAASDPGRASAGEEYARPSYSLDDLKAFQEKDSTAQLLFIAEQYLGKTLTHTEMETITYFYDTLHMSADLIEYLIESCVENGHKSMHYIRKVAFSWVEEGIETVSQAKEQSALYNKNCYTVLNAFGIKNRGPASSELTYIRKWADDYAFSPDIIAEACRRTITATHQPSFEYADSILTKWHEKNIRHLKDISALDDEYQKERSAGRTAARSRAATRNLNNFERRSYDMESLEEQLLNSN